jgi:hypothetical protein
MKMKITMKTILNASIWTLFLFTSVFVTSSAFSQNIKKGFHALEMHDYFKAKQIFEKRLKKEQAPASFGLAQIYFRNNNPFYNIDSAHRYIVQSIENYDLLKPKKQLKYQRFNFSMETATALRQEISNELFFRARQEDSESGYARFIADNFWATQVPYAVFLRDSCAFEFAAAASTSEAMQNFLDRYPTSAFEARAQDLFYRFQFEEQTRLGQEIDYANFIKEFPNNPYIVQADQKIFRFYEDKNSIKSYEKFIKIYPNSAYVAEAWIRLYRVFIRENGLAFLGVFKETYPTYPFMQELEQEISMMNAQLFPFVNNGKWGFMNHQGKVLIEPKFDFVDAFSQGRAAAGINDLYGFIDPLGTWVIQPQFTDVVPFRFNLSVVFNDMYEVGLINLFGEWILQPSFKDIIIINDEKVWVEHDDHFVLYDIKKNQFGTKQYNEISDFIDGLALVSDAQGYTLIDIKGNARFAFAEEVFRYGDLFLVTYNDSLALVDDENNIILPYDEYDIARFNPHGPTPFVIKDKLGYLNAEGKIIVPARLDIYPNWELFAGFFNNHAKAYNARTKKYGLIDEKGSWILQPRYNDISFFSDIIAVQITDKWEFINLSGQRLNFGLYDRAESFQNGVALVIRAGQQGLINKTGQIVVPIEMRRINRITDELLRWEDGEGAFWFAYLDGSLVWPEPCERIDIIDDNQIRFIVNGEVRYYIINERRIIAPDI